MSKEELIEYLNKGVSRELAVSTQYMWHHVMAVGPESPAVRDIFKEIAITEMKHAEKFAERICYLGGVPTTKPSKIKVGGDLKGMLSDDLEAEREAIGLYKKTIKLAEKEGDLVTVKMLEEILSDEEKHEDTFSSLLE
ncbi:MAG: bacterioferritin [Candidatus Methanofastidiosia archaeon]